MTANHLDLVLELFAAPGMATYPDEEARGTIDVSLPELSTVPHCHKSYNVLDRSLDVVGERQHGDAAKRPAATSKK